MGRVLSLCLAFVLAGCGPTIGSGDEGAAQTGDSGASTGQIDSRDDTTAVTTTSEPEADTGADDVPVDMPLVPAEHVSTSITCQEDGLAQVFVEVDLAILDPPSAQCTLALDHEEYMLIVVRDWNGGHGTFDVHPEGQAVAAAGDEYLEGTVTIEIWSHEHPSIMRVDLSSESMTYRGSLDLQRCLSFPEHCF